MVNNFLKFGAFILIGAIAYVVVMKFMEDQKAKKEGAISLPPTEKALTNDYL
jgi:hypothetical protein